MTLNQNDLVKTSNALRQFWIVRNNRFEEWYKLREMHDSRESRGQVSIALNEARTFFDLALFFISQRSPTIRVPTLGRADEEQERSDETEVALSALQRHIDTQRFRAGQEPWGRTLADYLLITGWYAVNNMVTKNADGTPEFISDIYDPAQVYPEYTSNELAKVAHIYPSTLGDVRVKQRLLKWEGDLTGDDTIEVDIHDVWYKEDDKVYNNVFIEGRGRGNSNITMLRDIKEPENLECIPIRVGPVAGWATRNSRPGASRDWQKYMGESILEAGRPMYDAQNFWTTIALRKAHETIEPLTVMRSRDGRWTIGENDLRAGAGIPARSDQDIEFKDRPRLTPDVANIVLPTLARGTQRAGISDLFFGNVQDMDLAGAGFAISLLEPNALSKLAPFSRAMEMIGSERDSLFLEEFRTGGYKPIKLVGRSDNFKDLRRVFYQEWSPETIPEHSVVDWEIELATPSQLIQSLSIARQAIPQGDLLDIDTVLESVLKVNEITRVKKGIATASMKRLPQVQAIDSVMNMEMYKDSLMEQATTLRAEGNARGAAIRDRAIGHVDAVIQATLTSIQGSNRGQTDVNGIPPQVGGNALTQQAAGTMGQMPETMIEQGGMQ